MSEWERERECEYVYEREKVLLEEDWNVWSIITYAYSSIISLLKISLDDDDNDNEDKSDDVKKFIKGLRSTS